MSEIFDEYIHVLSNPGHILAEITFMIILDVLILGLVWPFMSKFIKRKVHQEHKKDSHEDCGVPETEKPSPDS